MQLCMYKCTIHKSIKLTMDIWVPAPVTVGICSKLKGWGANLAELVLAWRLWLYFHDDEWMNGYIVEVDWYKSVATEC